MKDGEVPGDEAFRSAVSRSRLRALLRAVVDLVHPPACISCGAALTLPHALCPSCWRAMPFIERPFCERLGRPLPVDYGIPMLSPAALAEPPGFDRARAVVRYEGPGRALVHRLKYGDGLHLVPAMSAWMARAGAELAADADIVVPVPLHRFRLWRRRFNQAASLARPIAERASRPLLTDALRRVRSTAPQPGLTRKERAANLHHAFAVKGRNAERIRGARVLLVDDVLTTGATAEACTRALRKAGAARVDLLVFACVVPGD
jgi:ComF family protein